MSEEATKVDPNAGAHERLNDFHVRLNAVEADGHSFRERLQTIERSLLRQVGPLVDVVHTAAGVVADAVGGVPAKVAAVVEKAAEFVALRFKADGSCVKHNASSCVECQPTDDSPRS